VPAAQVVGVPEDAVIAELTSSELVAGWLATVVVRCIGPRPTGGMALPRSPGVRWVQMGRVRATSARVTIGGRQRTEHRIVAWLRPTRTGPLDVAPITVKFGSESRATNRLHAEVVAPSELIFLEPSYDGEPEPPKSLYVGQQLPVRLSLFAAADAHSELRGQLLPVADLTNAALQEYIAPDGQKHSFKPTVAFTYGSQGPTGLRRHRERRGDRWFEVHRFETGLTPLAPGTMGGSFSQRLTVTRKATGIHHRDLVPKKTPAEIVEIKRALADIPVLPLPPPPAGGAFLGLIGDWTVSLALDQRVVAVGDGVSLVLTAAGVGDAAALVVPELALHGITHHPPETRVDEDAGTVTVTWLLVPRDAQAQLGSFAFLTFDTAAADYAMHTFSPVLGVEPASVAVGAVWEPHGTDIDPAGDVAAATSIHYIKREQRAPVALPLVPTALPRLLALWVLAPAFYVCVALFCRRRERFARDPHHRRRHDARRRRRQVLAAVRNAPPEAVAAVVRGELHDYLTAVLDLPPGATTEEVAAAVEDSELATMLRAAAATHFGGGERALIDPARLAACVKALAPLLTLVLFVGLPAPPAQADAAAAAAAYDRGQLTTAVAHYQALLTDQGADPAVLYNLGNCAYRQGDFGQAMVYYERARRLAPRDAAIIENLNFVRAQAGITSTRRNGPAAAALELRDRLRPDEWLGLGTLLWCIGWLAAGLRRWQRRMPRWPMAVCFALAAAAVGASYAQQQSSYRPGQAIIVADETPVLPVPLPPTAAVPPKRLLQVGEAVDIRETRTEWCRVRAGQDEGWVRVTAVTPFWE
jgi:tetratricopeptide (TPR) repeat protein